MSISILLHLERYNVQGETEKKTYSLERHKKKIESKQKQIIQYRMKKHLVPSCEGGRGGEVYITVRAGVRGGAYSIVHDAEQQLLPPPLLFCL